MYKSKSTEKMREATTADAKLQYILGSRKWMEECY